MRLHVIRALPPRTEPASRLVDVSDGYRVAVEAYRLAADLGCSGDLFAALWDLVEREAAAAERLLVSHKDERP